MNQNCVQVWPDSLLAGQSEDRDLTPKTEPSCTYTDILLGALLRSQPSRADG